jgi:hypothetical protein
MYLYSQQFRPNKTSPMGAYLRGLGRFHARPRRALRGFRGLRGFGQDETDLPLTAPSWSNVPLDTLPPAAPVTEGTQPIDVGQGTLPLAPTSTFGPPVVGLTPATTNPLNYTSPQVALAAGVPAATVNAAYSQPGSGYTMIGNTWMSNTTLLAIGAGILGIAFLSGPGGRRR